jgi:PAS domain S-box-containing protein
MPDNTDSTVKQSAALIRKSFKRLFDALLEQTSDRIYIKDTAGRFVFTSDALIRTHGLAQRAEIEGMTDFDFFDKSVAEKFFAEEQKILKTKQSVVNRIESEMWIDGTRTWVSNSKVPLCLESGTPIGILGISRDVTEEHQQKEQLRQANETMLADYASAQKVQQVMIPGRMPAVSGVELAYLWKPMGAVGGDIISFPRNPDNKLLFFLADVCGHGVQAAFYTVLLKYITAHAAEVYTHSPQDFLDTVNRQIADKLNHGFITGMAGHFGEPANDGSRNLHLSHAGHPHILVLRKKSTQVETIQLPGSMVMGLPGGQAATTTQVPLQLGDRVYIFTDGIIEASAADGTEFGEQQVTATICSQAENSLQQSIDAIYQAANQHTGQSTQQDDITLLAFEISQPS